MAQTTTFSKRINVNPKNPENGWDLAEMSDGYLLLGPGGCTYDIDVACTNLIKVNEIGDTLWYKQLNFYPGGPRGLALWKDSLILIGATTHAEDDISIDRQKLVTCYDRNGKQLWHKEWGDTTKHEWGARLLLSGENVYCITTQEKGVEPTGDFLNQIEISKMDLQGNLIWQKEYGEEWVSAGSAQLKATSEGELILAYAMRDSIRPGLHSFVLSKLDTAGQAYWSTVYSYINPFYMPPPRLAVLPNDINILSWAKEDSVSGEIAPSLHFVNTEGDAFQQYTFTTADRAIRELRFLATASNGDILGGGTGWLEKDGVLGDWGGWLFRMSAAGELRWERNYVLRMGPFQENAYARPLNVIGTGDGGLLAIGNVDNLLPTGEYETDMWVLKLDSLGCLQPGCHAVNVLLPAGEPQPADATPPVLEIYPNPASVRVTVALPADVSGPKQILVTDALGRLMLQKTVDFSAGQAQISVADLPPGVYALTVGDAKGARASAMLVVKK